MSLVAILNETFENEPAGKVKKEMKEKILIAIFFGAIMLLVPFTAAVAHNADADVNTIREIRMFTVKLTTKELMRISAEFKDMIKDSFTLHQAVDKAFNDASTISRNNIVTFDLVKFGDILAPALELEGELLSDNQQMAGSNLPAAPNGNGVSGGRLLLNMQQTTGNALALTYGSETGGNEKLVNNPNNPPAFSNENPSDGSPGVSITTSSLSVYISDPEGDSFNWSITTTPDIGSSSGAGEFDDTKTCTISGLDYRTNYTWHVSATDTGSGQTTEATYTFTTPPKLWVTLQSLIPSLPDWRCDNDKIDVDGPAEKGPDDGHNWRGLDDYMDWNFIEDLIEHCIPLWILFTIAGLIGSVFSIGVLLLWLIPFQIMCGFELILFVFEAFDVMDLSYGFPGNKDGL